MFSYHCGMRSLDLALVSALRMPQVPIGACCLLVSAISPGSRPLFPIGHLCLFEHASPPISSPVASYRNGSTAGLIFRVSRNRFLRVFSGPSCVHDSPLHVSL